MFTSYHRVSDRSYLERFGLDFEHLQPGQRFAHRPGVTISQQDNVMEALESSNAAMVHYDECYAGNTSWKKPLMVSTITLQRLIGLATKTFGRHRRIVVLDNIALTKPVFGGDTLYVESEVIAVQPGDADCGLVSLRSRANNQHGAIVATLDYTLEIWRRDRAPVLPGRAATPVLEPRFASHVQRADGAWLEQTGLFFEDLLPDETFIHAVRRTILAEEATRHALHSGLWAPQYTDIEYARALGQTHLMVPEAWTLTLGAALSTHTFGRVTANLGWTGARFGAQVVPGDVVEARSTVLATRASATRPSEGIVTVRTEVFNQRAEAVVSFERSLLVYKRDAPNPYAASGY